MPGLVCAVACCRNSYVKSKQLGLNISLHKFPSNPVLHDLWVHATNAKNGFYVCNVHFRDEDFETTLKQKLLINEKNIRRILKSNAVPSLFLKRYDFDPLKANISDRNSQAETYVSNEDYATYSDSDDSDMTLEIKIEQEPSEEVKYHRLLEENELLREKYKQSRHVVDIQEEKIAKLEKKISTLNKELKNQSVLTKKFKKYLQNITATRLHRVQKS